jgi:hypothetical protein
VIEPKFRAETRRESELKLFISVSSKQFGGPRGMEANFIRQAVLPQGTALMGTTIVRGMFFVFVFLQKSPGVSSRRTGVSVTPIGTLTAN